MAGTVDGDGAKPERRQPGPQRGHHVGMIARGAMDQQDGAALRPDRRLFDDMKDALAGVDENADRRKTRLDPARPPVGEKKERAGKAEQRRQSQPDSAHHVSRRQPRRRFHRL